MTCSNKNKTLTEQEANCKLQYIFNCVKRLYFHRNSFSNQSVKRLTLKHMFRLRALVIFLLRLVLSKFTCSIACFVLPLLDPFIKYWY